MSECEKDFTKLSIKIDQASYPSSAEDVEKYLIKNNPSMSKDDAKKGAENMMDAINSMVKNGNMNICVKKCANKSLPMIMFDKSKEYKLNDAGRMLNDIDRFVCFSEPSSEMEFTPDLSPDRANNYTVNLKYPPLSDEQRNYTVNVKYPPLSPSLSPSLSSSSDDERMRISRQRDEAEEKNSTKENLSETDLYGKNGTKFKYKITYKCAQGEYYDGAKKCRYIPPFYLLNAALK